MRVAATGAESESVIQGWGLGTGISWGIMEPGFIALITFFPCICNLWLIHTINEVLGWFGCDLSILLG